jgi:hypothetical protein
MKTSTLAELTPLPGAVVAVLDAFREAHPEAELRLWGGQGGGRICLYPGGDANVEPWASVRTQTVHIADGPTLQLELRCSNGAAPPHRFLAHTLAQLLHHEREARSAARELTERYEEINLLYFISEILASVLSVPDAAERILSEVADVLGARRATLWVFDPDHRTLSAAASVGAQGPDLHR